MRRSDQRRDAVFALYQQEVTSRSLDELLAEARPFSRELAEGVMRERGEIDAELERHLDDWTLDRVAPLERSIMRTGVYEMRYREDVPTEVVLDEAVGLAKRYCGAGTPAFVNGVLGAIARQRVGEEA